MNKGRLEAFSDGVLAIIITIMVLGMEAPENVTMKSLFPVISIFVSYLLSYIYIGIYWINHHHIFQATQRVNSTILWANLNLLFWISLIPFTTSWVGENHLSPIPVAFYGGVLFMCALSFLILEAQLMRYHGKDFILRKVNPREKKEKWSIGIYLIAIPSAFLSVWISIGCYIIIACIWMIPGKRLEQEIEE